MEKQIFISYSHADINFVLWLREELKRRGYNAWIDSNSIKVGQIWREEIVEGIEASDYFMIILSASSVKSSNVVKELSLAESCGKILLPVLIEDVQIPAKMKYQLAGVQFIVLDKENSEVNIDLLVNSLKNQATGVKTGFLTQLMQRRGYVVKECISRIGREKTYRIEDVDRGRIAVLKVFQVTDTLVNQFAAESKKLECLRQQGIPLILDHFSSEGLYFLVQEYLQGTPWDEIQWNPEFITAQSRIILSLLASMHDRGIIHNDIRPQNLLYHPETNESSIVDLSLSQGSCFLNEASSPSRTSSTRKYFQAPELVRFSLLTPASDLYAFGVTILTLLSEQSPESIYLKESSCWMMNHIDPSIQRWLAPLLVDSSSQRIKSAKEVIHLIDAQNSPVVGTSMPDIQPKTEDNSRWSRKKLVECLVLNIGPIAETLVENNGESIEPKHQRLIRDKCEVNGIDGSILDECFQEAKQPTEAELRSNNSNEDLQENFRISDDLLQWLVTKIGPSARLVCNERMIDQLLHSPEKGRLRLESLGVPGDVIDALLPMIFSQTSNQKTINDQPKTDIPLSLRAPSPVKQAPRAEACNIDRYESDVTESLLSEEDIKGILVRQVGPMAIAVHDAYKCETDIQKRVHLIINRLRQLGIDEDSLQQLQKKLVYS